MQKPYAELTPVELYLAWTTKQMELQYRYNFLSQIPNLLGAYLSHHSSALRGSTLIVQKHHCEAVQARECHQVVSCQ